MSGKRGGEPLRRDLNGSYDEKIPNDNNKNDDDEEGDNIYILNSFANALENDTRPHVEVSLNGEKVIGLLDSGANCSILGQGAAELLRKVESSTLLMNSSIKTVDGSCHPIRKCAIW